MSNFIDELKRRKVFRVTATYAVVAWIIMQIGEVTFPALRLPDWVLTAVVVILLIGFPVVAIIAWIFDRTPDGIVITPSNSETSVNEPMTQVGNMDVKVDTRPFYLQKRNIFLVLGVLAGIIIGQFNLFDSEEKLVNYTGDRIPVAIADFENNTDDSSLDGLSGLLITSLEQSNYLSVLTRSRMLDLLKQLGKPNIKIVDEELGVEICERADINSLVLTSIRQFGDLYSVDLKILDVDKNEYLYSTNVQAEGKKNIPDLIDQISKQTRISLAERAEEVEKNQREIASLTTKNLEAYKYYDLGVKALNSLKWNESEKNFKKSIELDTTFALAHFQLAYRYQWNFMNALHDKHIKKAVKYIDSVPEKERLYIRAQSIKDFSSRIPIYEEIIDKYPNEKLAYFEIGDMLYHNNRVNESISYFEKSYDLDPSFEFAIQHLRWSYLGTKNHEKNIELAEKSLEIYPSDENYIYERIFSYLNAGKFDDYFSIVRDIDDTEVQNIDINFAFGRGYYITGDYKRATERLKQGENNPNDLYFRNSIYWLQHLAITRADQKAFIKYSDEALILYNKELNQLYYVYTLILRAEAMLHTFNDLKEGKEILVEIDNILKDLSSGVSFSKLGGVQKRHLIGAHGLANNKIRQRELYNQAFSVLSNNNLFSAKEFLDNENFQEAINIYNSYIVNGADAIGYITSNFYIGLAYMGLANYKKALGHFNLLRDVYNSSGGYRSFYYPKVFLYAGLCNLELKNYRLAKSNIETFLRIWEPAPESLKEKRMAREALEKINKAVS